MRWRKPCWTRTGMMRTLRLGESAAAAMLDLSLLGCWWSSGWEAGEFFQKTFWQPEKACSQLHSPNLMHRRCVSLCAPQCWTNDGFNRHASNWKTEEIAKAWVEKRSVNFNYWRLFLEGSGRQQWNIFVIDFSFLSVPALSFFRKTLVLCVLIFCDFGWGRSVTLSHILPCA